MATKSKVNGLNHTAGIYSDMTVDGPEIGTLVIIVDRARNLPNRKTIGKQDPYCAARLGKEAKKTETDRRGGQTPRWDQELRYTVHDSPDYYQLKVSVFNDDKKTDLIGETWVDLKEVVVPGGGQNDLWHTLNCKGKYAGEIRIEITYYDSRQKQEKPEKTKQAGTNGVEDGRDSLRGPRQPKASPVKRRPLPSDPVTGAPAPEPDYNQPPPRGYPAQTAVPDYTQTPPRGYQTPSAIPDHLQTSPGGYQSPSYILNQSPLQSVEYNTPLNQFMRSQSYDSPPSMNGYGGSPLTNATIAQPPPNDRYEMYDTLARNDFTPGNGMGRFDEEQEIDPRDPYDSPYDLPQPEAFRSPPSPGGPPPPPPVHRSRNNSAHVSPAPAMTSHGSYGFSRDRGNSNPYETPPHDVHRHSMPAHSSSYQAYTPDHDNDQFRRSANASYQESPPRHQHFDPTHNNSYGAMQPTVEDAPPSPGGHYSGQRGAGSRGSQCDDRRYDQVPSPAPLNLSGRGSSASGRNSVSTAPSHQYSNSSMGYTGSNSQVSYRSQTESISSFNSLPQQEYRQQRPSDDQLVTPGYGLPPVPATLVAGMDPIIAKEISDRIYDEKRASYNPNGNNSARGRYQNSPQYQSNRTHPHSYHEGSTPFVPATASYDERQSRFSTATAPVVKPRAISPDTRVPIRKSVSPSPGPSPLDEKRRLSGIPFGPDSYNALNPSLSGSMSTPSLSAAYKPEEPDPDAKIIMHDGREIDPSDHIPESNYAPLLEKKGPKYASQLPDRNYRPPPSQPVSSTSRRPLRQAGRPQSMATSTPIYMDSGPPDPSPPSGRNRLQKKSNRMSTQPLLNSSPLAPITPYQDNSFTPRSVPRANTGDFSASEKYAPGNYGSSPGYRGAAGPPPIPAKVPVHMNGPTSPQSGGADAWALLEEMKNIDLGSGRARRRGY